MSLPTLTTFVLYLAMMIALGVIAWRATRTLSDYVLGGRRLGGVAAALSAGASGMSGWLLLGLPGALYAHGLGQLWLAIGLTLGAYLNWTLVAARLRRFTAETGDALTIPDFLARRFPDRARSLRLVAAAVVLFFFTIYTASGLVAGGVLFASTFGLAYHHALWLGAALVVSYTFLGGFLAVSWTDVVQGTLMLVALIAVPAVAVQELGGWDAGVAAVGALSPDHLDAIAPLSPLAVVSLLAWGLGYFGQPHILARFMAMRSAGDVAEARAVNMTWMVLSLWGAMATGFLAVAIFAEAPLANPETAFIALTQALFNPWLAGVFLAAILAAIMSTADSQLLVSASALTNDLYRPFLQRDAGQRELVWVGRGTVVAIALVAVVLGWDPESRVLDIVAYAWAGFGAGFGPVVLLALLWRGMTADGALAGLICGSACVVIWANLDGGIFDLYEILPGFLVNLAVIGVVSLGSRH